MKTGTIEKAESELRLMLLMRRLLLRLLLQGLISMLSWRARCWRHMWHCQWHGEHVIRKQMGLSAAVGAKVVMKLLLRRRLR